jgi:hypothetical protein
MGRVFSACFVSGSLTPFLYSSNEIESMESLYLEMIEIVPYMINGDLEAVDTTPEIFWTKLDKLNNTLLSMHAGANHPIEKNLIFQKLVTVRKWVAEYNIVQNSGALREAPFSFCFHGLSGVGKTTAANLFNISILKANGFDCDPQKIVTHNENDKYFSNYRADVVTIVLDDICNTRTDMLEESPLVNLLKFKNNNPEYAVMADLASKGKIPVRPKTLLLTTNVPNLNAGDFSNEPLSMMRRIDMHIGVSVKPQFRTPGYHYLDQSLVIDYISSLSEDDQVCSDIWDFTVLKAIPHSSRTDDKMVSYLNLVDGTIVKDVKCLPDDIAKIGIKDLIRLGVKMSQTHFRNQRSVVRNANKLHETIHICDKCSNPRFCCECENSVQYGIERENIFDRVAYYQSCQNLYMYRLFGATFLNYPFMRVITFLVKPKFWFEFIKLRLFTLTVVCLYWYTFPSMWKLAMLIIVYLVVHISVSMLEEFDLCIRNSSLVPGYFSQLGNRVRETNLVWLFGGCVTVFAALKFVKSLIKVSKVDSHSGVTPEQEEALKRKLATVSQWDRTIVTPLPATQHAKCITTDRAITKVAKNVVYVRYLVPGKEVTTTNGFFVNSNILLLPRHNIPDIDFQLQIIRNIPDAPHNKFMTKISREMIYTFPGKDFTLIYISNGGDWSDMLPYFPLSEFRDVGFVMPYRARDGTISTFKGKTSNGNVTNGFTTFPGSNYFLSKPTFNGLCMAPLISDSVANIILGFHLGGVSDTTRGCSGRLLFSEISSAIIELQRMCNLPIATSEGVLRTSVYDAKVYDGPRIDKKSPVNYFSPDIPIDVYGSCPGGTSYYTKVEKSPISDLVASHCGDENIYAGPKFGPETWKPWYKALEGYSDVAVGPYPHVVKWATDDYIKPIVDYACQYPAFTDLKPLSDREVLNGIENVRFIDRMDRSKSVGFPLSGPLSNYMVVDELDGGEVILDQLFWDEVRTMEDNALAGVRSYPIFKASLKDEVTKVTKDKVRVFTAASLAHKLVLRKYFLPITTIFCADPTISECAVGTNAYGTEWSELIAHATQFGKDRIIAGDFKAYDQKLPPGITRSAFSVFIRLAKVLSYSERDIRIMEHLVSDVVHATVAYNGTLIGFNGSQPSGQNLTVFINNISNGILHRAAYYDSYTGDRSKIPPFRSMVGAIFYGDDSTGSIHKNCDWFNNIVMSSRMDEYGMTYTPPDKAGTHPAFRPHGEISFLKRDSRFDPEFGYEVGALEKTSIYKSLHCVMKSKFMSPSELSATNIDNSLREMFLHGREDYEDFRTKITKVAQEAELDHLCSNLTKPFDDCLIAWKEKYCTGYGTIGC